MSLEEVRGDGVVDEMRWDEMRKDEVTLDKNNLILIYFDVWS